MSDLEGFRLWIIHRYNAGRGLYLEKNMEGEDTENIEDLLKIYRFILLIMTEYKEEKESQNDN